MRQSEKWLAKNAANIIIAGENGDFFEGTRDQWRDCYFDNADDYQITSFCLKEGLDLVINGTKIIEGGNVVSENGYLGESVINIEESDEYKDFTPADWAMVFIGKYGQIDGDHHKSWVLDQVARILKGTPVVLSLACWKDHKPEWRVTLEDEPSAEYNTWVLEMKGDIVDGEHEYGYEEGIAP